MVDLSKLVPDDDAPPPNASAAEFNQWAQGKPREVVDEALKTQGFAQRLVPDSDIPETMPEPYKSMSKKYDTAQPPPEGSTAENWTGYGPPPADYKPGAWDTFIEAIGGRPGMTTRLMHPLSGPMFDPELNAQAAKDLPKVARAITTGASMGLADKIAAGADALFGKGTYAENLKQEQQTSADAAASVPGGKGFEALGAAATGAKLGQTAEGVAAGIGGGAPVRVIAQGLAGAGQTGLAAYNSGQSDSALENAKGAVLPAVAGGLVGGAAQGLGEGLGAGARAVAERGYAPHSETLPSYAADALLDTIGQQGIRQTRTALRDLGPSGTLADTGPATQGMAKGLAGMAAEDPTLAQSMVRNVTQRAANFQQHLADTVAAVAGPRPNYPQVMTDLRNTTSLNDAANYTAARAAAAPVDVRPALRMINQEVGGAVAAGVNPTNVQRSLIRVRGLINADDPTSVNLDQVNSALQDIGDAIGEATRAGRNNEARLLSNVRNQLTSDATANNPLFAVARAQHATDKSLEEAAEAGRNIFATKSDGEVFDPDAHELLLNNMSAPERTAYVVSARKAIDDKMAGASGDAAALAKLLRPGSYAYGKLEQLFGADALGHISDEVTRQATMQATNRAITSARDSALSAAGKSNIPYVPPAEAGPGLAPLIGAEIGQGGFGSVAGAVAGPIIRAGVKGFRAASTEAANLATQTGRRALGNALSNPAALGDVVDALTSRAAIRQRATQAEAFGRRLLNPLTGALANVIGNQGVKEEDQ